MCTLKNFITLLAITTLLITSCNQNETGDTAKSNEITELYAETSIDNSSIESNTHEYKFSVDEINSAIDLIERYFTARAKKIPEEIIECYHPSRLNWEEYNKGGIILFEQEKLELINIHEFNQEVQNSFSQTPLNYGFSKDNLLIIMVDYDVSFPDGNSNSSYSEGMYYNWAMILVRDNQDSPWLIFDQGY